MTAAIVCSDLSFSWPDGAPVLSGLTVSFGPSRTGLIGVNGSGKSTLLRLIAGELRPAPVRSAPAARWDTCRRPSPWGPVAPRRTCSASPPPGTPCTPSRRVRPGRRPSRRSGTTGTSRSAPAPGWTGWGWAVWGSTTEWNACPAARLSWSRWPRCSCGGRTSCCWTSRPTTSTWTRAGGCTKRSRPGPG